MRNVDSKNVRIAYQIGRHLAFMTFCFLLCDQYIHNIWLQAAVIIVVDIIMLKYGVIVALESRNGFAVRKSDLDGPFIIATSILLPLIGIAFNINIFTLVVLVVVNALVFNRLDANDEKLYISAKKAMKEYLDKHKSVKKSKTKK